MKQFVDRELEMRTLEREYAKKEASLVIVYGRRRVGKTALNNEFCKGKPTIYFSALNASAQENLEALSKAIAIYQNPEKNYAPVYQSFVEALEEVTRLARENVWCL